MAVHRYVNSAFWDQDDYSAGLAPLEKLVFLYLLTNSHTSIAGVYEIPTRTMVAELCMSQDEIERILAKFEADRKVYRRRSWIILANFPRHQKWDQRTRIKQGIEAVLKKIPLWLREDLESIPYTYPIDRVPIAYVYHPNGTPLESESESESESETESESEGECEGEGYPQAPPTAVSAGVESPAGRPGEAEPEPDAEAIADAVSQQLGPPAINLGGLPPQLRAATERARLKVEAEARRKAEHLAHKTADYRAVKPPANGTPYAARGAPPERDAEPVPADVQDFEEA